MSGRAGMGFYTKQVGREPAGSSLITAESAAQGH